MMGRPRIAWTSDMDAALIAMRREGCGYSRCGTRIGVDGDIVARRVRELGMPTWGHAGMQRDAAA